MSERTIARIIGVSVLAQALLQGEGRGGDWPQHKGDSARSGVTSEVLRLPLKGLWSLQPRQAPRPAWEEPGKEAHRLDFDFAPQPVIADGRVFFCSSADDTVRALDLGSGKVLWHFTLGGPARFAPAVAEGRVKRGSLVCLVSFGSGFTWGANLLRY